MDSLPMAVPYTGPRPSPARRWAPALEAVLGAAVITNVLLFVLNLVERHNLARAKALHPVSRAFFDDTLSTLTALNRIILVVMIAFIVLDIVWVNRRRGSKRRSELGDAGVEPALSVVSRRLWGTFWATFAVSIVAFAIARSSNHIGMTIDDFIKYRTWLAIAALCRAATWGCYLALVVAATRLQHRREAAGMGAAPAPPVPPPAPASPPPAPYTV